MLAKAADTRKARDFDAQRRFRGVALPRHMYLTLCILVQQVDGLQVSQLARLATAEELRALLADFCGGMRVVVVTMTAVAVFGCPRA